MLNVLDRQAYESNLTSTRRLVACDHSAALELVRSILSSYNLSEQTLLGMVADLSYSPAHLETFLMRFHHGLPEANSNSFRAYISALTIASGYFFGGLLPLMPYFFASTNQIAFYWSVVVMGFALCVFGYVKTMLVGESSKIGCLRGGLQMVVLGGIAAAAAMGCVKAVGGG